MSRFPAFLIAIVTSIKGIFFGIRSRLIKFFFHRNHVKHRCGSLASYGCPLQSFQSNFPVHLKLHGRHLQKFSTVFKSVFRCSLRRKGFIGRQRHSKQVLKSVVIFVTSKSTEGRCSFFSTGHRRSLLQFCGQPIDR